MRLLSTSTAIVVASALLVGCGGSEKKTSATTQSPPSTSAAPAASAPTGDTVTIQGFKYAPASISTKVGSKLTFKNTDNAEHTATADMKSAFDSGAITHGRSKAISFTKAGTYAYHCDFHPFMHGTVVVKAAPGGTATAAPARKPSKPAAKPAPKRSTGSTTTPRSSPSGGVGGGAGGY